MPSVRIRPCGHLTVVASVVVLAAVALPAVAGTRAPIVYANQGTDAPSSAARTAPSGPVDKATQRIEFRYPGQSAGADRVQMASATLPKMAPPAAEAAWTETPQFAPLTPGFDAAATAAQVAAASRGPVVEAAALQPMVPAPAPVSSPVGSAVFEQGMAIIYGDEFDGLPTSNGEIFDQTALTAAHPSLPLPSLVAVTNPATGREVVVRVNDRGPFEDNAVLQVSRQAARALGFEGAGKAELTLRLVGNAPADVSKVEVLDAERKPKLMLMSVRAPQTNADELLGGDELAGGASASTEPAPKRAAVKWPEPPSDWGVKPEPVKASVSAEGGSTYVQLASFSDIGNAEAMYRGLKGDLPVEIVPARVNGTDYFRVRVGPLASRDAAQQIRDRLSAEGKGDGRVVTAE
ncbi:septal ring lytic transglycosylase RlpA family protein [Hyphomonas sp.]|uniref:septal ring lytic transglycosylase RlpA family protein n=1 Tax=Hyphomonas sp. TaxID=87 RepID=UPI00391C307F